MWNVRVKDRGRDLVYHQVEGLEEAGELRAVYERLGYDPDKIVVERRPEESEQAA